MPEEVKDPITNLKLNLNTDTNNSQYWLNVPYLAPAIWTVNSSKLPNTLDNGTQIILKLPYALSANTSLIINGNSGKIVTKGGQRVTSFKKGSLLHLIYNNTSVTAEWIILN